MAFIFTGISKFYGHPKDAGLPNKLKKRKKRKMAFLFTGISVFYGHPEDASLPSKLKNLKKIKQDISLYRYIRI
jgi:adenylylsulfate kinase-like enzyme